MVFKAGEGAGRSGSFFFSTYDSRYLIKTMQGTEKQDFLRIIDDYIDHLIKNPNSLISRIYGIFTVLTPNFSSVDIVVM